MAAVIIRDISDDIERYVSVQLTVVEPKARFESSLKPRFIRLDA